MADGPSAGRPGTESVFLGPPGLRDAVEHIAVILTDIMPEAARQQTLPALRHRPDGHGHLQDVATQLAQRYGVSPLYRIVEVEPWSRIPERRHALLVFDP